MIEFQPPPFCPHPLIRGGHLQTLASVGGKPSGRLASIRSQVEVSDGDSIVLHDDRPESWREGDLSVLLIHGLTGCHGAPYMVRLAHRFMGHGMRVYRMDMRGFGAAYALSSNLSHAGRSDDVVAALDVIADQSNSGPMAAIGVSLGGSQLLRAMGRIGAGLDPAPSWINRIAAIAAVSPPLDLQRCSDNMQRRLLRPYNYYFIRSLLARVPLRVKQRQDYHQRISGSRPRTLQELDDRITAPLSGFADAGEYYAHSSASRVVGDLRVPAMVLAAADDPIVPLGCFVDESQAWSESTRLIIAPSGGHVGFIDRRRGSWMDAVLEAWLAHFRSHP